MPAVDTVPAYPFQFSPRVRFVTFGESGSRRTERHDWSGLLGGIGGGEARWSDGVSAAPVCDHNTGVIFPARASSRGRLASCTHIEAEGVNVKAVVASASASVTLVPPSVCFLVALLAVPTHATVGGDSAPSVWLASL